MRIYIVEDDTSVIGILEDIVEGNELGVVCGDSGGEPANLGQILALDPDLVLVDLLMPQKDGIQVVRELKEQGCRAKFIMISQVSNKEMVAKAYLAGVDFFINKPINLIEVRQVILNVRRQLENERGLHHLASLGLEDYGNEIFTLYASRLFPFQEVRAEMACIQGRGPKGKANLKRFLDGMLVLVEED